MKLAFLGEVRAPRWLMLGMIGVFGAGSTVIAHAHSRWVLPSEFIQSSEQPQWIDVDVSVSNTLFSFDKPYSWEGFKVWLPNGTEGPAIKGTTFKRHSVFSVELTAPGTYRIEQWQDSYGVMPPRPTQKPAEAMEGQAPAADKGQVKTSAKPEADKAQPNFRRLSASSLEALKAQLPEEMKDFPVIHRRSRVQSFVTKGTPTPDAVKPVGEGLEIKSSQWVTDFMVGDQVTLTLLLNGKPLPKAKVELTPGGTGWRNSRQAQQLQTDASGNVRVNWPIAGIYLIEAEHAEPSTEQGVKEERYSYSGTFAVQPGE
ncbi:DUF4198 domain-containing protein [Pokkaliibacter sp. CJK22405]|uniref:DUF4198 domain-containing protein n=1 Tax=Pokkaliibacter sp. CJK22405 TaxID=3384615 RepID=UPI003984BA0F